MSKSNSNISTDELKQSSLASYNEAVAASSKSTSKGIETWNTRVINDPNSSFSETLSMVFEGKKNGKLVKETKPWVVPTSFAELLQSVRRMYIPRWNRAPYVMSFPDFSGYSWRWRYQDYENRHLVEDQELFESIIKASIRTGRPPLCAPDCFLYPEARRPKFLSWMYHYRKSMFKGVEWSYSVETTFDSDIDETFPEWSLLLDCVAEKA